MPLEFEAFPGVAGDALRVQRGAHAVYATGALTVLATMVPQFSAGTRAVDGARVFTLRQILWLGLTMMRLGPDIPEATLLFRYIVNVTRIGIAMELLLAAPGDLDTSPCAPSVARRRLQLAAARVEESIPNAFYVLMADLYERYANYKSH